MTTKDIRRWTAAACADAKIYRRGQIMESPADAMAPTEKPVASTAFQCSSTDGSQSDVKTAHEQSPELGGQQVCSHETDVECPSQTPSLAPLRRLSPFSQALPSSEESDAFTGFRGDLFCFCARNFDSTLLRTAMNVWSFQMSDRSKGESLMKYLDRIRFPVAGFSALMLLGLISSSYAAIHLSLWNYDFPTEAERYLWRICGSVLASALPVGFVIYCVGFGLFFTGFYENLARRGDLGSSRAVRQHEGRGGFVAQHDTVAQDLDAVDPEAQNTTQSTYVAENGSPSIAKHISGYAVLAVRIAKHFSGYAVLAVILIVAVIVVGWWVIIYGFAREYLVIEAFISLRHVPKDVYEKVGWSLYLPHL